MEIRQPKTSKTFIFNFVLDCGKGAKIYFILNNFSHQEMVREVRRLSVLRDPSIAKVVAVATNLGGPIADGDASTLGVMTEYLEGGPLPCYLRQYRLGTTDNFEPGVKTIR